MGYALLFYSSFGQKNGVKIGVRQKMSHWDAKKINIMYGCHAGGGGGGGGGHLSWSPEHDDGDHDHIDPRLIDDSLSPLLSRNASSSPSSAEIEVAYDELDYDPGRSGRGSSPSVRSRSFHNDDDDHHQDDDQGEDDGGSSEENFGRVNHRTHTDGYSNHHPEQPRSSGYPQNGPSHHHQDEPNNHFDSGGHNNNQNGFIRGTNHHPQSYSHFSLDTYPGGGGDVGHQDNNVANDDFYDF